MPQFNMMFHPSAPPPWMTMHHDPAVISANSQRISITQFIFNPYSPTNTTNSKPNSPTTTATTTTTSTTKGTCLIEFYNPLRKQKLLLFPNQGKAHLQGDIRAQVEEWSLVQEIVKHLGKFSLKLGELTENQRATKEASDGGIWLCRKQCKV